MMLMMFSHRSAMRGGCINRPAIGMGMEESHKCCDRRRGRSSLVGVEHELATDDRGDQRNHHQSMLIHPIFGIRHGDAKTKALLDHAQCCR